MSTDSNPSSVKKNEIVDLTDSPETQNGADIIRQQQREREQSPEVIDLTLDADSPVNAYELGLIMTPPRKRKRPEKVVIDIDSREIIDVDAFTSDPLQSQQNNDIDDDALYRQSLGPLRMEIVTKFAPPHYFADSLQKPYLNTAKLYRELIEYKINLPVHARSSIFVRAQESRLDLLRVAITGPEGTPYENGAPRVQFMTTGDKTFRFNPNLYACGKVCLSLLGTWSGPGWEANQSTLLQVLMSLQALVLVSDPYFNEPGYNRTQLNAAMESEKYNRNIRRYTVSYALRDMLKHATGSSGMYVEWQEILQLHFQHRSAKIQQRLQEWVAENNTLKTKAKEIETLLEMLHVAD